MRSIQIEVAAPTGLSGILALLTASGLPRDGMTEGLDAAPIACDSVAVVGSAALEHYDNAALLRSGAIATALRGQGLGPEPTRPPSGSSAVPGGSTRSRRPPRATSPPSLARR
jgi:hypothetical protein